MKLLVIVVAEKWVNGLVLPACRDQPHGELRPLAARASWLISACAELSYSGALAVLRLMTRAAHALGLDAMRAEFRRAEEIAPRCGCRPRSPISFLQFRFGADGGARAFGANDHEAPRRPKRTGAPNSRRRRRRPAPPELQTAPPELRRRRGQQPDRQIRRTGPEKAADALGGPGALLLQNQSTKMSGGCCGPLARSSFGLIFSSEKKAADWVGRFFVEPML